MGGDVSNTMSPSLNFAVVKRLHQVAISLALPDALEPVPYKRTSGP
jgi:hypothetical protein